MNIEAIYSRPGCATKHGHIVGASPCALGVLFMRLFTGETISVDGDFVKSVSHYQLRTEAIERLAEARHEASLLVAHIDAGIPMVRTWGGPSVTGEYFDHIREVSLRAGTDEPFYAFISGEPYSRWA